MLAQSGAYSRLLNVATASGSLQPLRSFLFCDPVSLAYPLSSIRAHSSKREQKPPGEQSPSAEWPEIKEHVQALRSASSTSQRELRDSAATAVVNAVTTAGNWVERTWATLLKWRIDQEFDLSDFQAGARHAFQTVNELLGSNEMHHLRPMLSPRLHQALSDMRTAYKQEGCTVSVEVEDILEQNIMVAELHNQKHMARFGITTNMADEASESPAPQSDGHATAGKQQENQAAEEEQRSASSQPTATSKLRFGDLEHLAKIPIWLAVTVRFRGRIITKVTDSNGRVLSEDDDRRSQYWKFLRGPLPNKLPAESIKAPWLLLTMQ